MYKSNKKKGIVGSKPSEVTFAACHKPWRTNLTFGKNSPGGIKMVAASYFENAVFQHRDRSWSEMIGRLMEFRKYVRCCPKHTTRATL